MEIYICSIFVCVGGGGGGGGGVERICRSIFGFGRIWGVYIDFRGSGKYIWVRENLGGICGL